MAPASPAYRLQLLRLYATLQAALNDAVRRARLIPYNPALGIELESGARLMHASGHPRPSSNGRPPGNGPAR